MNQSQFTKFLAEMEMTNSELVPRLFHAFDRDNTGALDGRIKIRTFFDGYPAIASSGLKLSIAMLTTVTWACLDLLLTSLCPPLAPDMGISIA